MSIYERQGKFPVLNSPTELITTRIQVAPCGRINSVNTFFADSLQFQPMHRMPYLDMYLRNRVERRRTIVSEHGPYTRALTARRDLSIRRFLCHMSVEESSAFCSTPNTNWDWFRHVVESFGEKE